MRRFTTAGHLASWAGMCPGNHESGGKRRSGKARKGNRALRAALCEAAWSAARTKTGYLPTQYRHLMRTFGKKGQTRAVFAVGHSILVIAWHLLANNSDYHDLGAEHFNRHTDPEARKHYLIRQLQALGHTVTVEPPSSRGEFHPPALTDPYVNLSVHTALVVLVTRLWGRSCS